MKFLGEISDFKMRLRSQMQKDNLIDSNGPSESSTVKSSSSMFVPITPTGKLTAVSAPVPKIAPIIAPPTPIANDTSTTSTTKIEKSLETLDINSVDTEKDPNTDEAMDDKTAAKLRKKSEKDAALAMQKREEEERQRRREEKLREFEEAKRLKDDLQRRQQEFLAEKAAKEVHKLTHL